MLTSAAEIIREYGPFPGIEGVNGVTFDGQNVWFASGDKLNALDPVSGKTVGSIEVAAHAGTAFDGEHLFQLAEERIQKIDPKTGRVLSTIPTPSGGGAGLAWAEGSLWMGRHRDRKILQIDPETGATLRTIESNRFVTGVTWVDGELWHGAWEGDECELRRVDPRTGAVLESLRDAARSGRVGARVRWRRSVLRWRRKERQAESRPPAQARLRGRRRLHDQVDEAALAGGKPLRPIPASPTGVRRPHTGSAIAGNIRNGARDDRRPTRSR